MGTNMSTELTTLYPRTNELDYWIEVIERSGQSHLWRLKDIDSNMDINDRIRIWTSNLPVQSQFWSDFGVLTRSQLSNLVENDQIMNGLLEYQELFQNWNFEDQIEFACKLDPTYKAQLAKFKSSKQLLDYIKDSLYPELTTEELIDLWKKQNQCNQVTPLTKALSNLVPEENMYVEKRGYWQPVSGMEYYLVNNLILDHFTEAIRKVLTKE